MELYPDIDLTNPHGLFVRAYSVSDKEEAAGQKVLEGIREKYSSQAVMRDPNTILIGSGGDRYSLRLVEKPDCRILVLVSNLPQATKDWAHHAADYLHRGQPILQLLPERPISQFSVLVGFADSQEVAINLSEQCSRNLERVEKARGITRGCLVAAFDTVAAQDSDYLSQGFLVVSFRKSLSDSKPDISRFHQEFIRLAEFAGKLDTLYRSNEPFFKSLGTAEQETQETIERETLENIFLNVGNIGRTQISRLETWLGELVTKFSGLSLLASAIRRDCAAAEMYVTEIGGLLGQWNEKALEGYPTNASAEMLQCEAKIKRFRNFLDRADALRTQLETVLGSIQTYLGFAQQKTAERQGNILKLLTWVLAAFTTILVLLEVLAALHILR